MKALSLRESITLLKKYKIPFAKGDFAKTKSEALKISRKLNFPLVMKISSRKIIHKTDINALILGINSEEEVKKTFNKLIEISKKLEARIDGILIQEMLDGVEVIIGGKNDEQFGQTILFGMGGIYTEIYRDFSLRLIPINKNDAKEMVRETKAYSILSGFRGKKYDVKSLEKFILKVGKFLEKNRNVIELDLNPVFVTKKGCFAVDARVVVK